MPSYDSDGRALLLIELSQLLIALRILVRTVLVVDVQVTAHHTRIAIWSSALTCLSRLFIDVAQALLVAIANVAAEIFQKLLLVFLTLNHHLLLLATLILLRERRTMTAWRPCTLTFKQGCRDMRSICLRQILQFPA